MSKHIGWKERWTQEGPLLYKSDLGTLRLLNDGWYIWPEFKNENGYIDSKTGPFKRPREAARFCEWRHEQVRRKQERHHREIPKPASYGWSRPEFWIG